MKQSLELSLATKNCRSTYEIGPQCRQHGMRETFRHRQVAEGASVNLPRRDSLSLVLAQPSAGRSAGRPADECRPGLPDQARIDDRRWRRPGAYLLRAVALRPRLRCSSSTRSAPARRRPGAAARPGAQLAGREPPAAAARAECAPVNRAGKWLEVLHLPGKAGQAECAADVELRPAETRMNACCVADRLSAAWGHTVTGAACVRVATRFA